MFAASLAAFGLAVPRLAAAAASAPAAPRTPAATSGNASATVRWSAPSSNGSAVVAYVITPVRDSVPQAPRTFTSAATTQVVTGLENGTPYVFQVAAVNAVGTGPAASTAPIVVGLPGAPPFPTAVPGNASAKVSWWAAAPNGSPVTGYVVTPMVGGVAQAPRTFPGTATSRVVTGLANGTTYTFRISAVNANGTGPPAATAAVLVGLPAAPTSPSAVSGNSAATVRWAAPANNGSTITGYVVTPVVGGVAQAPQSFPSSATTQVVSGLPNGAGVTFRIAAVNAVGTGPVATTAAVTVGLPGAPPFPAAAPGNGAATVAWWAAAANGSAVTGYVVTPVVGGVAQSPRSFPATPTSQVVTGLANGSVVSFRVVAVNAVGSGPAVATGSVTVGAPATPTKVTATAGAAGSGRATVAWVVPAANASAITSYVITPSKAGVVQPKITVAAPASSAVVADLAVGASYTFTVAATNAVGTGPASAASNATVPPVGPPATPTGATAVAGDGQATVSWVAPANTGGSPITGYVVTPRAGSTALPAQVFDAASTTQVVTGLTNGTSYTFTVAARNAQGLGAASGGSAAVVPTGAPGAPTAVTTLASNGRVTLSWVAPSNGGAPITGYVVIPSVDGIAQAPVTFADPSTREIIDGLTNGTPVSFTVRATNAVGTGPASVATDAVTPSVPPTPGPGTIDILGDSITAQAFWNRDADFSAQGQPEAADLLKDGLSGRKIEDILQTERSRIWEAKRPSMMVVALGTNNALVDGGGWTTSDEVAFRALLDLPSPDACVVVVLPGYAAQASAAFRAQEDLGRAYMAATAPSRPNTYVVDWGAKTSAHPELLGPDGIHLDRSQALPGQQASPASADAFAATVWEGVQQCPNHEESAGGLPFHGLSHPVGVAVDAAGTTYVADTSKDRILALSAEGVQRTLPFEGLDDPTGLAVDGAGTVYVGDTSNDRVVALSSEGVQQTVALEGIDNPVGVAVDANGTLFVADTGNSRIVARPAGGPQRTLAFTGLLHPGGVAVAADGTVVVADTGNDRVVALNPVDVQSTLAFTGLSYPVAVNVSPAGTVYVADAGNGRVLGLDPGGTPTILTSTLLTNPAGLAVDGSGGIVVTDNARNRVLVLTR